LSATRDRFGLSAAMTLPVQTDGAIDLPRLLAHAGWCLANGCDSVTAFGTTGEGPSIGLADRYRITGALLGAGIPGRKIVGGLAATSLDEALAQARLALDAGCRALLLPPPYYFKGVSDDGLFAWFAAFFEKLGGAARDVILYNIPSVTEVPLSVALIGRLKAAFPGIVAGVKDSSGDWAYTEALLAAHGDLVILIGDERYLAQGVALGGQGSISGLANVCPDRLARLIDRAEPDEGISRLVELVLKYPVTPAVKALVAHRTGDAAWLNVRPPLVPISVSDAAAIGAGYDAIFNRRAA
jgi:Dihydrodipicolinate synthase/N-acetylneuraminate lyase